jgi:hypothetical protein
MIAWKAIDFMDTLTLVGEIIQMINTPLPDMYFYWPIPQSPKAHTNKKLLLRALLRPNTWRWLMLEIRPYSIECF